VLVCWLTSAPSFAATRAIEWHVFSMLIVREAITVLGKTFEERWDKKRANAQVSWRHGDATLTELMADLFTLHSHF
jgi:hypothetical protein